MKSPVVFVMKSAVSWWFFGPIFGIFAVVGVMGAMKDVASLYVLIPAILFIGLLFVNTRYRIHEDGYLRVVSGIIPFPKIEIQSLTRVSYTNNPFSAPALSLKRLALYRNNQLVGLISPVDRAKFIEELQKVNPNIQVK